MKIDRAMKKVALLKGDISDLQHRIENCVSTIKGNEWEEVFYELLTSYKKKVDELIALKVKIMTANIQNEYYQNILRVGELKGMAQFVGNLSIKRGRKTQGYSEENIVEYDSQISVSERNKMKESIKVDIIRLTDELDDFNRSTDI